METCSFDLTCGKGTNQREVRGRVQLRPLHGQEGDFTAGMKGIYWPQELALLGVAQHVVGLVNNDHGIVEDVPRGQIVAELCHWVACFTSWSLGRKTPAGCAQVHCSERCPRQQVLFRGKLRLEPSGEGSGQSSTVHSAHALTALFAERCHFKLDAKPLCQFVGLRGRDAPLFRLGFFQKLYQRGRAHPSFQRHGLCGELRLHMGKVATVLIRPPKQLMVEVACQGFGRKDWQFLALVGEVLVQHGDEDLQIATNRRSPCHMQALYLEKPALVFPAPILASISRRLHGENGCATASALVFGSEECESKTGIEPHECCYQHLCCC